MIPDPWAGVLLALAAYRVWHLLAEDTLLDRARRRLYRLGDWDEDEAPFPPEYRAGLDNFIGCPYCFGFWIALAWFAAYQLDQHYTVLVAVPLALSAVVALLGRS